MPSPVRPAAVAIPRRDLAFVLALVGAVVLAVAPRVAAGGEVLATEYDSIQAAIDANPGGVIRVPAGDHAIDRAIRIEKDGTKLVGFGRIVQSDPKQAIVRVEGARDAMIRDLVLTRPADIEGADEPGIDARDSPGLRVEGVSVRGNRSGQGSISVERCEGARISDCSIRDYKRIAVDDRTDSEHYGYAFRCIDGHGIVVRSSRGVSISECEIVEERLLPTREAMEAHDLGALVEGRRPSRRGTLSTGAFDRGRVDNWHQGSAILATDPEATAFVRIVGNRIVGCAQGIDLHCDMALVRGNAIDGAMIGIKAMHGSRNLIVSENLISRVDLWGILLAAGTGSRAASEASGDEPARPANADGGTIVANNAIVDFGYGHEWWNWGGARDDLGSGFAIRIDKGQLPDNPPVRDVLIEGNMVYDSARDGIVEDGKVVRPGPRYRYALYVEPIPERGAGEDASYPVGIVARGNVFEPGAQGAANVPWE